MSESELSVHTFFQKLILTLLFQRSQGHHHIEGEAETNKIYQGLENLGSVEEFKKLKSQWSKETSSISL